ncbi:DegV family protein with EDD domain [Actinocorallia herbida]|uniref:DegV family protein with EDD domain n=1 Tax=Actinocorallia herbida TaxID=58109 RepID=A0A3N1CQN1_9ACTN|nr:DegV family protein [Actinocorallia herbida]ROO83621.1 DegV family protein with EDD domain [Actinocorallia herbida]
MGVAIVTDSSAYLPSELLSRYAIGVVPLQIIIGGKVRDDGVDITSADAADALRSWQPVSTSRPSPDRFADAYKAASGAGADAVVSVHLSGDMSGTVECARMAAAEAPVPVRVVDSRTIGMSLGFAALAGAVAAEAGGTLDEVAEAVRERAEASSALFYVDTLEHLRRGGRIGAAATLLGSALMVKPLLNLADGRIAPLEKVRTSAKALSRLEELAVSRAGTGSVDVAVQHVGSPARAKGLAESLRRRIPALRTLHLGEVGPVIGAHVGPGMLGVAISPCA